MSSDRRCSIGLSVCHVKVYCNKWHFGKNVSDLWTLMCIILQKVELFLRLPRSLRNLGYRTVNLGAKDTEIQFSIWRVRVWPPSLPSFLGCPGCSELLLLEALVWDTNGLRWRLEWNGFVRAPFMLALILGPPLVQNVTIPKMVIKVANLPQGFLLLPISCPQESESREACRRAVPNLLLKPALQDELEIVPPRRENRAGLSWVFCCATSITLGCYGLCGAAQK